MFIISILPLSCEQSYRYSTLVGLTTTYLQALTGTAFAWLSQARQWMDRCTETDLIYVLMVKQHSQHKHFNDSKYQCWNNKMFMLQSCPYFIYSQYINGKEKSSFLKGEYLPHISLELPWYNSCKDTISSVWSILVTYRPCDQSE